MQDRSMNSQPARVRWWRRLYVRNYLAVLVSIVVQGGLFGVAWFYWHAIPHAGPRSPIVLVIVLGFLALTVATGAFPVVRRMTRRLEYLQQSVEALGAGQLSARVAVEGQDEVASLAASFNRSAAHIESLLLAQKNLLCNASHELRSPLARIRMAVELLQERAPPELRRELIRNIAELDQLIDEILLASRLDARPDCKPSLEPIDLTAEVAQECALVDAQLEAQAVTVRGDAKLLRRMLRNLLENARRYGGGTPVMVRLEINADRQIQLDVIDYGPGVAPTEREKIFEPFYRLPGSSESEGGVGLGLSLVRQIAGAHGGSAHCVAPDHTGSRFRILLPMP
jgi:signal transduction histidine kinase